MELKDKETWDEIVKINIDDYSACAVRYMQTWAEMMEEAMARGFTLEEIAKETSNEADMEGITGAQYGVAVSYLSKVWIHGDKLREWHNLDVQIGTEGEEANKKGTTLNPAMLVIGKK